MAASQAKPSEAAKPGDQVQLHFSPPSLSLLLFLLFSCFVLRLAAFHWLWSKWHKLATVAAVAAAAACAAAAVAR